MADYFTILEVFNSMVVIRLSRGGAKKRPFYHIVVADSRCPRDGRLIERVGIFNPIAKGQEVRLRIDMAILEKWLATGAQMSDRVKSLAKEYARNGNQEIKAMAEAA